MLGGGSRDAWYLVKGGDGREHYSGHVGLDRDGDHLRAGARARCHIGCRLDSMSPDVERRKGHRGPVDTVTTVLVIVRVLPRVIHVLMRARQRLFCLPVHESEPVVRILADVPVVATPCALRLELVALFLL